MGTLVKKLMGELRCVWSIGNTVISQQCRLLATKPTTTTAAQDQAIKKPVGPYAAYVRDKHADVIRRYPNKKTPDVMKHIGAMWKNEPGFIRYRYTTAYKNQMATYKERVAALQPPKKPGSPYSLYVKDNFALVRAKNPTLAMVDVVKQVALKWGSETASTKERYSKSYASQMEKYRSSLTEEDILRIKEKKENKMARAERRVVRKYGKVAARDQPQKPKVNAYHIFVREQKGSLDGGSGRGSFLKEMGNKWKKMSDNDKIVYQKKADDLYDAYEDELREWGKQYL